MKKVKRPPKEWRKYVHVTYNEGLIYLVYSKELKKSIIQREMPILKIYKDEIKWLKNG